MKRPFPYSNRRITVKPSNIENDTRFFPKLSDVTKQKKQEKQPRLEELDSGLDKCAVVCLYIFLVICIIVGGGGIGVCVYYFNTDSTTQGWKIGGIAMGAVVCVIGIILIILSIWKRSGDRPWRYETQEKIISSESYTKKVDPLKIDNLDDDELHDYLDKLKDEKEEDEEELTRDTASSPIPNQSYSPLKTFHDDLIYCPGCNRLHPPEHQCMFSTQVPNSLATKPKPPEKEIPKNESHTVIDRTTKYSITNETQTKSTSTKPNITESVVLRRVPIPTTKVIVQQPTTKVMIVRVPNVAGQLVLHPPKSTTSTDEK